MRANSERRGRGPWRMLGALALSLGLASQAFAAPSTKIGTAILLTPSAADGFYGAATTATNSIGSSARPNEIKELVRALKGNPDLIYEYVRNNTEIVWTYGLSKGAMGVVIDKAGTAFDQAHLMVELLREAGYTAGYKVGTITLTGTQFADWSGIMSATAACQLLSSGGIPAVINGSTSATCAYGSATVSTIEVGHVWVAATINSVEYVFDPAYKGHSFKTGLNLTTATGLTTGEALTAASTGTTDGTASGVNYTLNLNASSLTTKLNSYATSLETAVAAVTPTPSIADVVGGQTVTATSTPANGLRQVSLPYTSSVLRTITGNVPDQYRTQLTVQITKLRPDTSTPTIVNKIVYVDEIYGRRLIFDTNFDTTGASFTGALKLVDENGAYVSLASATYADAPDYSKGAITLVVNAPYAAGANGSSTVDGSYMDTTITRPVTYALPFMIVHGWGDTGRGLIDKWGSRLEAQITPRPDYSCDTCFTTARAWKGDGRRELLGAEWLAQASRAGRLHAAIAKSIFAQHYAVGISSADTYVQKTDRNAGVGSPNYAYWISDSFDRVDVETGVSLTSTSATATDRRAALQAIAATISALKGSVDAQVADLPDSGSTATRFSWGNAPPSADDPSGAAARRFYRFTNATDAGYAYALAKTEYTDTTSADGTHTSSSVTIGSTETLARRQALSDAVNAYTTAGFTVVASEEALLGPGQRGGAFHKSGSTYTHEQTPQRGGALVATRYDGNGDPVEIAHVIVNPAGAFDGGGAGVQTFHQEQYDPATAADVSKGRFINAASSPGVDLVTGGVTMASPASITTGNAGFPYSLTGQIYFRGGDAKDESYGVETHRQPQGPWLTNWSNGLYISGSGLEAMGETDPRAAINTVADFVAVQDLFRSTPSLKRDVAAELVMAAWVKGLTQNVVTLNVGLDTRQFLKKRDGTWFAPGASDYATLVQTGQPTVEALTPNNQAGQPVIGYTPSRGWGYNSVNFAFTHGAGDILSFRPWSATLNSSGTWVRQRGFELYSWAWPSGVTLSISYTNSNTPISGYGPYVHDLSFVTNAIGANLYLTNAGPGGFNIGIGAGKTLAVSALDAQPITHTDQAGAVTKFEISTTGQDLNLHYRLNRVYLADDQTNPALQYIYDTLGRAKEARDALVLRGSRAASQFLLANGLRSETIDALGYSSIIAYDLYGRPIKTTNALGYASTLTYDGRGRLATTTLPEGNKVQVDYNDRNQPIKVTRFAKPSSAEAGQSTYTETGWSTDYALPLWTRDAKGAQTDYTISLGQITKVTHPAATTGATRYEGNLYYYANGLPMGFTNETGGSLTAGYYSDAALDWKATDANTWDVTKGPTGDPATVVTPRGGHWDFAYDVMRRRTLSVESWVNSVTDLRGATRTTYDIMGRATKVERGSYSFNSGSGSVFTPLLASQTEFDAVGNVTKVITPTSVTQYAYDALNRVTCVAVRMNPGVYASLPSDACVPSTAGASGPDRISRKVYDAVGHVIAEEIGVGSDLKQAAARYGYSANGLKTTLTDANGNMSTLAYDGFDRLKRLYYPASPRGSGVSSTTDYEEYTYDVNDNRASFRKRDGRVINYQYDALNRVIVKDLPGSTADDVYYTYDGAGRLTEARFGSATNPIALKREYDDLGRLLDEYTLRGTTLWDLAKRYDSEGHVSLVNSVKDAATYYQYDLLGRLSEMSSRSYPWTPIVDFNYDILDRRTAILRNGNVGARSDYIYDNAGRLEGITHRGSSPSSTFSQTFTYNPAGQTSGVAQGGAAFVWSGQPTTTTNFTHDALNRDAAIAAAAGYDANGNLISDGVRTFTYDVENRLTGVTGGSSPLTLKYDPLGRLTQTTAGSTSTEFIYDGNRLLQEVNSADLSTLRWYAYGNHDDEPLIWYDHLGPNSDKLNYLLQDRLGSVIGAADAVGNVTPYTYGPYGEPQSWAGSRYRYTGQIALPEAQLYYYKARVYDPNMGRFLQTDPIGYDDGLNIYAYTHGDPVNGTDPSGNWDTSATVVSEIVVAGYRFQIPVYWAASFQIHLANSDVIVPVFPGVDINGIRIAPKPECLEAKDELRKFMENLDKAGKIIKGVGTATVAAEAIEELASAGFATPAVMLEAGGSVGVIKFGDALQTAASMGRAVLDRDLVGGGIVAAQNVMLNYLAEKIGGRYGASDAVREALGGIAGDIVDKAKDATKSCKG